MIAVPRISAGCASRIASSVSFAIALDESRAERVGRDAERAHVVFERDALDDLLVRGARVDQRAAERLEETARRVQPSGAMLGDLAGAAGDDVLVTFAAALRVVGRPEAVGDGFGFFEDEAVVVERAQRLDVVFVDGVERPDPAREAVGAIVEAGRRFGVSIATRIGCAFELSLSGMTKPRAAAIVGRARRACQQDGRGHDHQH